MNPAREIETENVLADRRQNAPPFADGMRRVFAAATSSRMPVDPRLVDTNILPLDLRRRRF
jgi:hypothetical protein